MSNTVNLKTYAEVLQELENNPHQKHLLLGNGFNLSLGVKTGYKNIFEKMKEEYPGYSKVENDFRQCDHDIEALIKRLKSTVSKNEFLPQYIARKIKLDFMKAAYGIVKKEIKKVYQEKNQEIYLLLKNFTNYFTLNYDPLLYLLLMQFKKDVPLSYLAFQNNALFIEEDLDQTHNDICHEIEKAYDNGKLLITIDDEEQSLTKDLNKCTKTEFTQSVKTYFKDKNWTAKDIESAVKIIFDKKNKRRTLNPINDGFLSEELNPEYLRIQNLFFLHGAFHIYQDKYNIKKITQKRDKAFYERLEKIINDEEKDIICILAGTSKEKKQNIYENRYLKKCLYELSKLNGLLVILGILLKENDQHIFEQINKSSIDTIYISSCEDSKDTDIEEVKKRFPDKKVILFDYNTISYNDA